VVDQGATVTMSFKCVAFVCILAVAQVVVTSAASDGVSSPSPVRSLTVEDPYKNKPNNKPGHNSNKPGHNSNKPGHNNNKPGHNHNKPGHNTHPKPTPRPHHPGQKNSTHQKPPHHQQQHHQHGGPKNQHHTPSHAKPHHVKVSPAPVSDSSGVGASCPGGTCQSTSTDCNGNYVAGLCPGAADVQCCQSAGTPGDNRSQLVACGNTIYAQRYNMHYTEGSQRWSGITGQVYPPNAPPYSDCSSTVTWCYWTIFGNGPDFVNNENWQAGYTGTMSDNSQVIDCSDMQPGDIILYGTTSSWAHVEMYMGNGKTISHGTDPASYESSTSNQGFQTFSCRTYPQVDQ